ncbi:MAG: hypothetical protein FJ387_08375 [Verrucomicrobia bacterium]|nr:hypothetical protein [Verrucomicrobiota bacterium]
MVGSVGRWQKRGAMSTKPCCRNCGPACLRASTYRRRPTGPVSSAARQLLRHGAHDRRGSASPLRSNRDARRWTKGLGICLTACLWVPDPLQAALSLDAGFKPAVRGGGGVVRAVEGQPDGKWLVAGTFAFADGQPRVDLTRLNADGTLDATFNPGSGPNGSVSVIRRLADGKIVLGGGFTEFAGKPALRLARVYADGALDEDLRPGDLFPNDHVSALAVLSDGRLAVASYRLDRPAALPLALLRSNGQRETSFAPSFANGIHPPAISAILEQPDGRLLVAGLFLEVNGQARRGLARLFPDGSLDPSLNVVLDAPAATLLHAAALQDDGKIVLVGDFTSVNGQPRHAVARVGANGELDLGFHVSHPALTAQSAVFSVAVQADGKLLLVGRFASNAPGPLELDVLRLNADGSADATFVGHVDADPAELTREGIRGVRTLGQGRSLIWGGFRSVEGVAVTGLARLDNSGLPEASFTANLEEGGQVYSVARLPDGRLLCGGAFRMIDQTPRANLALLNPDGTTDGSLDPGTTFASGHVNRVAVQADGNFLASGYVPDANGALQPKFRRLLTNGAEDSSFAPAFAPSGGGQSVQALLPLPDGRLLLGGAFVIGTNPRSQNVNVVRLLASGAVDPTFTGAPQVDQPVHALALQPDGKMLIAGGFNGVSGVSRPCLARLHADGTLDTQFDASLTVTQAVVGASSRLESVLVQPNGAIVVAGLFRTASSEERWSVARLNPDGSRDLTFQLARPSQEEGRPFLATALAPATSNRVWVGSGVWIPDRSSSAMLTRLGANGVVETAFQIVVERPGYPSATPTSLLLQPDGGIVLAGFFSKLAGQPRHALARLIANERPRLDTVARHDHATTLGFGTISDPQATYRIRHTSASNLLLAIAQWSVLAETIPADGTRRTVLDWTQDPNRFYALELVP